MKEFARPGERTAVRVRELSRPVDAVSALAALRPAPAPWLLDSALRDPRLGRYSFAGVDPYLIARLGPGGIELDWRRRVRSLPGEPQRDADPFAALAGLLPPAPAAMPELDLPFVGGAVGYLAYELGEKSQPVRLTQRDVLAGGPELADATLLFVDQLLAVDHGRQRAFALGLGFASDEATAGQRAEERAAKLQVALDARQLPAATQCRAQDPGERSRLLATELSPATRAFFDEPAYADAVRGLQHEIEAGNVYQANLTHRLDLPFEGDPWSLYRELRSLSPAPFAAYLELPEGAVLSSSPERFLRLDTHRHVESRPIKGTRPRGDDAASDRALSRELAVSTKDRAENLMIVDLVRNDLGRVCELGTVGVPELMCVERYASVFQLVSTVRGVLRPDARAADLVRACFPPGSMTGAPKIAAMRLIDRVEPVRRGVYSGALGYLDVRGGLDLSVVIRTLLVAQGRAFLHVGGGIVYDSDPVAEYRETIDKARALVAAVSRASEGTPAQASIRV